MKIFTLSLFIASFISTAYCACDEMQIQDLKINTCDNKDLVRNVNFTASLDNDCNVVPSGCLEVKRTISNGTVTYSMRKNGMPPIKFEGKKGICPLLKSSKGSPEVTLALKLVKAPNECPIPDGYLCATGSISIAKYRSHLKAATGEFSGKVTAVTNAGDVCVTMSLKMVKENSQGSYMGQIG